MVGRRKQGGKEAAAIAGTKERLALAACVAWAEA
jgi:hypothetical protein